MALNLIDSYLIVQRAYAGNTVWVGWGACVPLLFGPLLYLYTRSLLIAVFRLTIREWLHFVPFAVLFILSERAYILQTSALREALLDRMRGRDVPKPFYWASAAILFYFIAYAAAALAMIRRYRRLAVNTYSDDQLISISWLRNTILYFTLCIVLAAANGYLRSTWLSAYYYVLLSAFLFIIILFINRVLLKAMRRPELFALLPSSAPKAPDSSRINDPMGRPGSYDSPVVFSTESTRIAADASIAEMIKKVVSHMEIAKAYLDPELTLEGLAKQIGVPPRMLSQLINQSLHQNFFDFVNRYRIEAAKKLLTDPKDKKNDDFGGVVRGRI